MDSSAILEQTAPDPGGGIGACLVTFVAVEGEGDDLRERPRGMAHKLPRRHA